MIKINEDFEIEWDGNCWNLFEWYDGFKKSGDKKVHCRKRKAPLYYPTLRSLCEAVINRSAGNACRDAENIIEAIQHAVTSIKESICGELGAGNYRDMWR